MKRLVVVVGVVAVATVILADERGVLVIGSRRIGRVRPPAGGGGSPDGYEPVRTPTAHAAVVVPQELPVHVEPPARTRYEIRWWRGYVKSMFYVVAIEATGEARIVLESHMFRWSKKEPPPQRNDVLQAHRQLVDLLAARGWEASGNSDHWFSLATGSRHDETVGEIAQPRTAPARRRLWIEAAGARTLGL